MPDYFGPTIGKGIKIPPFGNALTYDINSRLPDFFSQANQKTYLTPAEFTRYLQERTKPATDILGRQFGEAYGRTVGDFTSRGQLYGGSLTGALGQLEGGYGQNLSDILSRMTASLGEQDLSLGAQRSGQYLAAGQNQQQMLLSLFQAILGGQYGIAGAKAGRPSAWGQIASGLGSTALAGASLLSGK